MKHIHLLIIICLAIILSAGIYRHDVDKHNYLELAKQSEFDCVGQVFIDSVPMGSAVLIDPYHLLLSAHQFDKLNHSQKVSVRFNISATSTSSKSLIYEIDSIFLHPEYASSKNCDLAICSLKIKADLQPAKLYNGNNELHSKIIGVGYGVSGKSTEIEKVAPLNEKIAGQNVIDSIGGYIHEGKNSLLYYDFDDPERNYNRMGSDTPEELEYFASGGDSGGGIFMRTEGSEYLIGIVTGGGVQIDLLVKSMSYYGQINNATRVSAFGNWIKSKVKDKQ
jgi:secreted trypsin-like serine protease